MRSTILVATLGAVLSGLLLVGACVDYSVDRPPEQRDLTVSEIRARLHSGSFRDKLAARKQIGKLPRVERLRVLTALTEESDAPTRTIAVQELGKMLPDDGARATLSRIAADDPDEGVRGLAAEKIAPQSPAR